MAMIRQQIYLEPAQNQALKQAARQAGVPEAELIRAAIEHHLHAVHPGRSDLALWDEELAFLQHLTQQPATPTPRSWQRDDLHERYDPRRHERARLCL